MKSFSVLVTAGVIAVALGACAPTATSGKSSAASSAIGCDFDAKRACESVFTQSITMMGGGAGGMQGTAASAFVQQNGPATHWVINPMKLPGGSEVDVSCQVNLQQHKVIYAEAKPAGEISDADKGYIRQSGYCLGGERGGQVAGSPQQ